MQGCPRHLISILLLGASTASAQPAPPAVPPTTTPTTPPPEPTPPEPTPPTATPASAPPAEENLLAHINEDDQSKPTGHADTFGKELRFFGLETNWSGYGDLVFEVTPNTRTSTFDSSHFNPILSVRMTDNLSGELELEFEHGGTEIIAEYAMLDWTPLGTPDLVIRAGKFLTPIGRFNEQLHPSFRWIQIDRPLMMTEVIPVEWSTVGLQVRGQLKHGELAFDYAAYVANGLGEAEEPAGAMDEDEAGFVAGLKNNNVDNNFDKALGGRVALTSSHAEASSISIGLSGYTGKVDPHGAERLTIVDVDLYARQGGLVVNGEAAQIFFGTKGNYWTSFERGAYLQLGYIVGKITVSARYDYAELGPEAGPLVDYHQFAGTVKYAPAPSWAVRVEVTEPLQPSDLNSNTRLAAMASFVF